MTAYDRQGKVIGTVGEEQGVPAEPEEFAVSGKAIARVDLSTDGRSGAGPPATWSSLPISLFVFDR